MEPIRLLAQLAAAKDGSDAISITPVQMRGNSGN